MDQSEWGPDSLEAPNAERMEGGLSELHERLARRRRKQAAVSGVALVLVVAAAVVTQLRPSDHQATPVTVPITAPSSTTVASTTTTKGATTTTAAIPVDLLGQQPTDRILYTDQQEISVMSTSTGKVTAIGNVKQFTSNTYAQITPVSVDWLHNEMAFVVFNGESTNARSIYYGKIEPFSAGHMPTKVIANVTGYQLRLTPDGKSIVYDTNNPGVDSQIRLYDIASHKNSLLLDTGTQDVTAEAFSRDVTKMYVSVSPHGTNSAGQGSQLVLPLYAGTQTVAKLEKVSFSSVIASGVNYQGYTILAVRSNGNFVLDANDSANSVSADAGYKNIIVEVSQDGKLIRVWQPAFSGNEIDQLGAVSYNGERLLMLHSVANGAGLFDTDFKIIGADGSSQKVVTIQLNPLIHGVDYFSW